MRDFHFTPAGKSSLLSAILGEMFAQGGSVSVAGSISFTQQDPWIQNMTLRDNVLMGEPYDAARYQRVLKACAMGTGRLLAVCWGGCWLCRSPPAAPCMLPHGHTYT